MCQLVLVLFAVVAGYAGAANIDVQCCKVKSVGGLDYTLVELEDTTNYGCDWNCVYERVGFTGPRVCFKAGGLPVICKTCNMSLIETHCQVCLDQCTPDGTDECLNCINNIGKCPENLAACGLDGDDAEDDAEETTMKTPTANTSTTTTYNTTVFVAVRLSGSPWHGWRVGPGRVDAIEFTSSTDIHIHGISMFGSWGSSSLTGLMEMKEGGSVLTSQNFQYTSVGGTGYYDQMFAKQGYARAGVKYTLTVEYSTTARLWYAYGGEDWISVVCNGATITIKFTDSSDSNIGSDKFYGQIPRIIFAC